MERPHGFPEASAVSPQLYLGGMFDAYDSELVARLSVTHVLLLANLPGAWDARKNRYVQTRLPLPASVEVHSVPMRDDDYSQEGRDIPGQALSADVLESCSDFIGMALLNVHGRHQRGPVVLVCCGDARGCSSNCLGGIVATTFLAARAGHALSGEGSSSRNEGNGGNINSEHRAVAVERAMMAVRDARFVAFQGEPADAVLSALVDFESRLTGGGQTTSVERLRDIIRDLEGDIDDTGGGPGRGSGRNGGGGGAGAGAGRGGGSFTRGGSGSDGEGKDSDGKEEDGGDSDSCGFPDGRASTSRRSRSSSSSSSRRGEERLASVMAGSSSLKSYLSFVFRGGSSRRRAGESPDELKQQERHKLPMGCCSPCKPKVLPEVVAKEGGDVEEKEGGADGEMPDEVRRHKNKIAEEVLTLHCPECGMAFIDFTNCFALWCALCDCAFCAYCQKSCRRERNDAHNHVERCEYNIAPSKSIFASRNIFEHSQNLRRVRAVAEYLDALPSDGTGTLGGTSTVEGSQVIEASSVVTNDEERNRDWDKPRQRPMRALVADAIQKDLADLGIATAVDAASGEVTLEVKTRLPTGRAASYWNGGGRGSAYGGGVGGYGGGSNRRRRRQQQRGSYF